MQERPEFLPEIKIQSVPGNNTGLRWVILFILFNLFIVPDILVAQVRYPVITTQQLQGMLMDQKQPLVLIDARPAQEYQERHITGAINIPYKNHMNKFDQLPQDKAVLLVIYCNGIRCSRSHQLADQIDLSGYTNIMIYSEGITVWQEQLLPMDVGKEDGQEIVIRCDPLSAN